MPQQYIPSLEVQLELPEQLWRRETARAHSAAFQRLQSIEEITALRLQETAKKSDIPTMKQISDALRSSGVAPLILSGLPGSGGASILIDTWANLPPAPSRPIGDLFWASDRTVLYMVQAVSGANTWVYTTGTARTTLAGIITGLGTNDAGFLNFITDYSHTLRWSGSAWTWAPADDGSDYYRMYENAPSGFGASAWQVCDGSIVARLNPDGTTTNVTVPNLTTAAYLKGGTAAAAVAAASGRTTSDSAGTPAGTNSAPAFTGTPGTTGNDGDVGVNIASAGATLVALNPHTHTFTPAGTVAAPAFAGNALAGHDHGPNTLELRNKQAALYYRR